MERWFRSLRVELTDRALIWNVPHLMRLLREYETFYNDHRPHRSLGQAAPLRPLPENVIDLDAFRVSMPIGESGSRSTASCCAPSALLRPACRKRRAGAIQLAYLYLA